MFFTKTPGVGGRIRQRIEDFRVEEIEDAPLHRKVEGGDHTVFWMEKFNWETNQALREIAKKLHASDAKFCIAGTKDKRAVTRQRVSVRGISEEQLKNVKIRDIRLYGFSKGERVNLGDMRGNRFTITIRDIGLTDEELRVRLEKIGEELKAGIPNVFGPQRFGEVRPVTHLVGKEMALGNFEEAVKIYLCKVFKEEPDDSKEARTFLSKNWGIKERYIEALDRYPMRLKYERGMIDYLYKHPNDYAGVLRRLPAKLRKMFLNALQSWIWNTTVERMKKLPDVLVIPGYDTKSVPKEMKDAMKKIGVGFRDFESRGMPELSCSGGERATALSVNDFAAEVGDDELNAGRKKATVSFMLPSGSYATVVLKEVMKSKI